MTEDTFTRELERRADDVRGAPFSFDDVRTKARSIRRRRRAAAGAVAVVIAAAVIVPATLMGGGRAAPDPAPSPPTETPVTPVTPGSSVLHDGVLTRPDGSAVPLDLDTADVLQLGVLTDGRVVAATQEPYAVQVYGSDGLLEKQYDVAANAITMSADHTAAVWVDDTFRVTMLQSGTAEPLVFDGGIPMPGETAGSLDAVLGSDCAAGDCTVLGGDFVTTTTVVDPGGNRPMVTTGEALHVTAVSPDGERWAVTFPPGEDEQFGCSGIYDPAEGKVLARSCDVTLTSFSPDGTYLTSARGDNQMAGSVEVLDEDLEVVRTFSPTGGRVVKEFGWADADHLLVTVATLDAEPEWSLLRVPVEGGKPENVAGPEPGPNPEEASQFVISD